MARVRGRILGFLERLYEFGAGEHGNNEVDITSPVQRVHDVSRQAELFAIETPWFSWFDVQTDLAHAGAGTLEAAVNVYDQAISTRRIAVESKDLNIWLMYLSYMQDTTQTGASANLGLAAIRGALTQGDIPIMAWGNTPVVVNDNNGGTYDRSAVTIFGPAEPGPLFMPIPRESTLRYSSTAAAIGNVRFHAVFWAGKPGSYPPGLY